MKKIRRKKKKSVQFSVSISVSSFSEAMTAFLLFHRIHPGNPAGAGRNLTLGRCSMKESGDLGALASVMGL